MANAKKLWEKGQTKQKTTPAASSGPAASSVNNIVKNTQSAAAGQQRVSQSAVDQMLADVQKSRYATVSEVIRAGQKPVTAQPAQQSKITAGRESTTPLQKQTGSASIKDRLAKAAQTSRIGKDSTANKPLPAMTAGGALTGITSTAKPAVTDTIRKLNSLAADIRSNENDLINMNRRLSVLKAKANKGDASAVDSYNQLADRYNQKFDAYVANIGIYNTLYQGEYRDSAVRQNYAQREYQEFRRQNRDAGVRQAYQQRRLEEELSAPRQIDIGKEGTRTIEHTPTRAEQAVGGALSYYGSGFAQAGGLIAKDLFREDGGQGHSATENVFNVGKSTEVAAAARAWDKVKAGGRDWADGLMKAGHELDERGEIQIKLAKQGLGTVGQALVDLGVVAIQMAGDIGLAVATGGSMLVPMGLRSYGNGYLTAEQMGYSGGEAELYGLGVAAVEVLSEKMFSVFSIAERYAKGVVKQEMSERVINAVVTRMAKSTTGRTALNRLMTLLFSAGSEGLEEVMAGIMEPVIRKATLDHSINVKQEIDWENALYEGLIGGILGGLGGAVDLRNTRATYWKYYKQGINENIERFEEAARKYGIESKEAQQAAKAVWDGGTRKMQEIAGWDPEGRPVTYHQLAALEEARAYGRQNGAQGPSLADSLNPESLGKYLENEEKIRRQEAARREEAARLEAEEKARVDAEKTAQSSPQDELTETSRAGASDEETVRLDTARSAQMRGTDVNNLTPQGLADLSEIPEEELTQEEKDELQYGSGAVEDLGRYTGLAQRMGAPVAGRSSARVASSPAANVERTGNEDITRRVNDLAGRLQSKGLQSVERIKADPRMNGMRVGDVIFINERLSGAAAEAATMGHEVVHFAGDFDAQLINDLIAAMRRQGRDIDGLVETKREIYRKQFAEMGQAWDEEQMNQAYFEEEVAADFIGEICRADSETLDRIAAKEPGLIRRIINALRNLLDRLTGKQATVYQQAIDRLNAALEKAGQNKNAAREDGEIRYALRIANSDTVYDFGITQEDINDYVDKAYTKENDDDYRRYLRVDDRLAKDVGDDIPDILEYSHALRDNDIRHIRNSHGEGTNEKYPVTAADQKAIPDIVKHYDKVFYAENPGRPGSYGLYYIKVTGENLVYYLEAASVKKHNKKLLVNKQMIKTGINDIPDIPGLVEAIMKKQPLDDLLADLQEIRKVYVQDVSHQSAASDHMLTRPAADVKSGNVKVQPEDDLQATIRQLTEQVAKLADRLDATSSAGADELASPARTPDVAATESTTATETKAETAPAKQGEDYMAAVDAGDMETARRMVEEAAKAAGYDLHLYHGSRKGGGFTVFRDWQYFTGSRKYAERYQERDNPDSLYEVFARSDRMFDTRNAEAAELFEQHRGEYGMGELQENGLPDWTDGYDISEMIEENELDYDGVILDEGGDLVDGEPVSRGPSYILRKSNQVKSAEPVTYDDDGEIIPLSQRFDLSKEDIRFSLNDDPELERARRQAEYWKQLALKNSGVKDVDKLTRDLMRGYGSRASRSEMSGRMRELEEFLRSGGSETEARATARQMAEDMLNKAAVPEDAADSEYHAAFRRYFRTNSISVPEEVKRGWPDGWGRFRRRYFGRLNLKNDGMDVTKIYREASQQWPDLLPSDEVVMRAQDQLETIAEVLDNLEPNMVNPYGSGPEFDAAVDSLAEDIISSLTRTEEAKATAREEARRERIDRSIDELEGEVQERVLEDPAELIAASRAAKQKQQQAQKIMRTLRLNQQESKLVDSLLSGALTVDQLPDGIDRRGVLQAYRAKVAVREAQAPVDEYNARRRAKLDQDAADLTEHSDEWKDRKSRFGYDRETARRNFQDIAGAAAGAMIDTYVQPIREHEAEKTRMVSRYNDRIKKLKLDTKTRHGNKVSEAYAVQYVGEAEFIRDWLEQMPEGAERGGVTYREAMTMLDEFWRENPNLDQDRIHAAVAEFRSVYDELFAMINEARVVNGYAPIDYRKGYFPHFTSDSADNIIQSLANGLGFGVEVTELPTDIAGTTHLFRPGIQWSGHMLRRTGNETDYNALEGWDRYIPAVANIIYHTEDIQRLRALERTLRHKYSDKTVQDEIERTRNSRDLTETQKNSILDELFKRDVTHLNYFVQWLREYTNQLAGKRADLDRVAEAEAGRKLYRIVQKFENRVAANMLGGNISSAMTNFVPLFQAWGNVSTGSMIRAMWDTTAGAVKHDGFRDSSDFLVNRKGYDPIYQTLFDKTKNGLFMPFNIVDDFVSETIVRARYYDELKRGYSPAVALQEADTFAGGVMADRAVGELPVIFNSKNPFVKVFTMFQVEVNNDLSHFFKDVPRDVKERGIKA
ncbi:MAG: hypothetical protein IJI40_05215, partial [Firmicutes bacterium]|nr:hypothetical protein [Bacillota bacterium]